MHTFVIRATSYSAGGDRIIQNFAVLSDSAESAMVAVIRDQPIGVLIERTDWVLPPAEARALTVSANKPRLIPEPAQPLGPGPPSSEPRS